MVSMVLMPFSAQAGLIGTDQAIANAQDLANRDKVRDFVSRGDVIKQLEGMGLSGTIAQERVNAMTQEEVNRIAGKIDSMPAGANDAWAWILGILIVGGIIWYVWYR